jgi:hypothetical protein
MLPCLLASPTIIRIGAKPYLVRPLTLGGFALLLRNGADALEMDGDGGELPDFGDDRFQAWLTGAGAPLLLWECLKADEPGLTLAGCEALARDLGGGISALIGVALRRARMAVPGEGKGKDVARLDWATTIYRRYEESGALPAAVAGLTLDQAWLLASGGKGFEPPSDPVVDDMQRRWEEMRGKVEPPSDPGPVPEGVPDDVAADVAAMGLVFAPEGDSDER